MNGRWDENFTKVLDHLTPEAGGIAKVRKRTTLHRLDYLLGSGGVWLDALGENFFGDLGVKLRIARQHVGSEI